MAQTEMKQFEKIIDESLYFHHFQPIFAVDELKACGYEGLLRSQYIKNPQHLFDVATKTERLAQLDWGSFTKAMDHLNEHFNYFARDSEFFFNVYPSTLVSDRFLSEFTAYLETTSIPANHLILELNESEFIEDFSQLYTVVKELQKLGIRVALDDIGRGLSPFTRALELYPDMIKLDKYFSDNLAKQPAKQNVLKTIVNYCHDTKVTAILEGVEERKDFEVAKDLGVKYVQGFLLGKPDTLANHFSMIQHH